jgi:hypothetical protein
MPVRGSIRTTWFAKGVSEYSETKSCEADGRDLGCAVVASASNLPIRKEGYVLCLGSIFAVWGRREEQGHRDAGGQTGRLWRGRRR